MAKRNRFKAQPITPVTGMREYLGDGSFLMTVLVMALFAFIHQRVSAAELEYGGGGIWCVLGVPAGFCLLISSAIACLGARTKLLPAIAPILGLGGVAASLVMFFRDSARSFWNLCEIWIFLFPFALVHLPLTGQSIQQLHSYMDNSDS